MKMDLMPRRTSGIEMCLACRDEWNMCEGQSWDHDQREERERGSKFSARRFSHGRVAARAGHQSRGFRRICN